MIGFLSVIRVQILPKKCHKHGWNSLPNVATQHIQLTTYRSKCTPFLASPFPHPYFYLFPILRITYQLNLEHYFLQTVSKYEAPHSFQPKS